MAYTRSKGMEFWYEFDALTAYNDGFDSLYAASAAGVAQDIWRAARDNDIYPAAFGQWVSARRQAWIQIAELQTNVFNTHWAGNWDDIQSAFNDFGQGVLYDPRPMRQPNNMIHTMDGQVGAQMIGYHRWHASIRAVQVVLPEQGAWWDRLAKCVGTAWAIQSVARPRQQNQANPGLAPNVIASVVSAWAPLTAAELDAQYDRTGGVTGYHPDPRNPG